MPQIIWNITNQWGDSGPDGMPQKVQGPVAGGISCQGEGDERLSVAVLAYEV